VNDLEIAVDHWLAREQGDEIARATLGQLTLRVRGRSLTWLEDRLARANRMFANLSAYDLAIWLASNWWRLRWEPERQEAEWRMAHSLAAIGGGYVWPDVTFSSDGEQMTFEVRPTGGQSWEPIRYLETGIFVLPVMEFEMAVDAFLESVFARLASCNVSGTALHLLWQELRSERRDPEIAALRRREALLGFDAGEAPDELLDGLSAKAEVEGRSAVDEVAAEFRSSASEILEAVDDGLNRYGTRLDGGSVLELGNLRADWDIPGPPWKRAEQAATLARKIWHLEGGPVATDRLVEIFGASPSLIDDPGPPNVPMPAAKWTTPERKTWSAILRSRYKAGKRFDFCRLIADGLIAPGNELLLPATDAKTSRQKFQRAFAQEFLCPFDVLRDKLGSLPPKDEDIEDAAQYFEVSPLLIRSKLANKGVLPRF
jgi:hypothetical protein